MRVAEGLDAPGAPGGGAEKGDLLGRPAGRLAARAAGAAAAPGAAAAAAGAGRGAQRLRQGSGVAQGPAVGGRFGLTAQHGGAEQHGDWLPAAAAVAPLLGALNVGGGRCLAAGCGDEEQLFEGGALVWAVKLLGPEANDFSALRRFRT